MLKLFEVGGCRSIDYLQVAKNKTDAIQQFFGSTDGVTSRCFKRTREVNPTPRIKNLNILIEKEEKKIREAQQFIQELKSKRDKIQFLVDVEIVK